MEIGWINQNTEGLLLRIRATPNASKDEILGTQIRDDGLCYLSLKVHAAPAENDANIAIIALLAKAFGIAKSHLEIVSGHKSRVKIILVKSPTVSIEALYQKLQGLNTK